MRELKEKILTALMVVCLGSIAQAQTDSTKQIQTDTTAQNVNIPESYMSTQEQLEEVGNSGSATYNIDVNTPPAEQGAAVYEPVEETEELRVYSGRHDGNNYVKTVQVKVPASRTGNAYTNYQPK